MRQHHVAGDKAFVDYSGKRIAIVDPTTGEIREAEIFVGVLGASSFTYAKATWTQSAAGLDRRPRPHLRFFGGAPELLVPDKPKTASSRRPSTSPRSIGPTPRWPRITNRCPAGEAEKAARQGEGFILHPVPLKAP